MSIMGPSAVGPWWCTPLWLVSRVMEVIGRDGVEEHRVILVRWLSVPHRVVRMSAEQKKFTGDVQIILSKAKFTLYLSGIFEKHLTIYKDFQNGLATTH